ncbi:MAG: VCBS repeat-containing protein [Planctomycetes bacterium]|nr:VCBS repeat-containing protein [Planctomycetota bacterium]
MLRTNTVGPGVIWCGGTGRQTPVRRLQARRATHRVLVAGAILAVGVHSGPFTASSKAQEATVVDIGVESRFQDGWGGHFKRGKANVAADFDLDGRVDVYLGNPGDESFVLWNAGEDEEGITQFQVSQILLEGELAWGAAAADYDNDGDYDLFITCGANEGLGPCFLFANRFIETGTLSFEDVTDEAGVRGAIPPGETEPIEDRHANCVWGDYNQDGNVDVFVSVNIQGSAGTGRNILWRNNGDGTFTDVTDELGLGASIRGTRHSTFIDIDNDGDLDLYENNFALGAESFQILWQNQLVETGLPGFVDVTDEWSPPGEDLHYPDRSFASACADFNNDGWQDLISFVRIGEFDGPYGIGHAIFINQGGTGFVNVAEETNINMAFETTAGVMGSQVGDLNGDGVVDVFIGNGGPPSGQFNQLFISDADAAPPGSVPSYINMSDLIDFPAPEHPALEYPPYPYRTHGTNFVDVDGDGVLELCVINGGPASSSDEVREPNRLFVFDWGAAFNYFKVRPVGDAEHVSLDAIGTRFALTISEGDGEPWTLYNTLFAGSGFSAQQGFEVYFGLAQADTVHSLTITWPDGSQETLTEGLAVNTSMVVEYVQATCQGDANGDGIVDPLDAGFVLARFGCAVGEGDEGCDTADQNGDGIVDPLDAGFILARFGDCP